MSKPTTALFCFFVCMGLTTIVLNRPALDPFITGKSAGLAMCFLFVILSFTWFKRPQYQDLLYRGMVYCACNAVAALLGSRVWIDVLPVSVAPPNMLAAHYGWGGEMAEEALIIEMYVMLFSLLAGAEYVIFRALNSKGAS